MRCPGDGFFLAIALVAGLCSAQVLQPPTNPSHYVEIQLPPSVPSESVFIQYVLAGEDLGGWVQPRPGVSVCRISTSHDGRPAKRIKALLYAPGCAIQTLDLPVSDSNDQPYSFVCRSLPSVAITGTLTRTDRLYGRGV